MYICDYQSTPIADGKFHFEGINDLEDIACATATVGRKNNSYRLRGDDLSAKPKELLR